MTSRTPSSLKWLIVKRSRLSGALAKAEARKKQLLDQLATLDGQLDTLRRQLSGIDETLSIHEIQINPEEIRPVQPQGRRKLMPPGQLSRVILSELRRAEGWLSSSELLARIADNITNDECTYKEAKHSLRRRLGKLARDGVLERQNFLTSKGQHDGKSDALWRIADKLVLG